MTENIDALKNFGISTTQAVEVANAIADLLRRLTPLDLEKEIACITMTPSLHWWQKVFLIRKLKKLIAERKNQNG